MVRKERGSLAGEVVGNFILDGSTTEDYTELLDHIDRLLQWSHRANLYVTIDFEAAMINALKAYFPHVHIIGCFFHFKQAIIRWITRHGSSESWKQQTEGSGRKQIKTSLFVPLNEQLTDLAKGAQDWKTTAARFIAYWSAFDMCFVTYMQRTWLNDDALFPPNLGAKGRMQFPEFNKLDQTNNEAEREHNTFGKLFNKKETFKNFILVARRIEESMRTQSEQLLRTKVVSVTPTIPGKETTSQASTSFKKRKPLPKNFD